MKRFVPRSTYIRIVGVLGIICSFIMLIFSLFLTQQFSKNALEEIHSLTDKQLQQTIISTEFTLDKLKRYSINMYQDPEIMNWMSAAKGGAVLDYNAILALRRYISSEPFIDNAYLINERIGHVIDYKRGAFPIQSFPDRQILEQLERKEPEYFRYFYYEADGTPYWGIILPPDIYRADYHASLVVLLNLKVVGEYFHNDREQSGVQVAIMDENGKPVLGNDDEEWNETIYRHASSTEATHFRLSYEDEPYYAAAADLNTKTWKLYYIVKMDKWVQKVNHYNRVIVLSSAIVLCALILVLFWNSRKHFKPLSFLAQTMQQLTAGNRDVRTDASEYELIKRGIDTLVHSRDEMMSTIRNHESLIMSEHLRHWILQGSMTPHMKAFVEGKSPLFECSSIRISVIRIDRYSEFKEKYNFESRKLMKYAMGNIAQELLRNENWVSEAVDMGGDHLVLLIGEDVESSKAESLLIPSVLPKVQDQILSWLEIQTTIAIGSPRAAMEDLRGSYDNMYEATTFKFISGEDRIYLEKDLEAYDTMMQSPDDAMLLERIIQAVRLGQAESMRGYLDRLFDQLQQLSYTQCKYQLIFIMHTIMRAFHSILTLQSKQGIVIDVDRFTTLQAFREWLESQLVLVMQTIQNNSRSGRKEELVKEMTEYIHNHLHSFQLNLEEVADHLSLSPGYVRQLFKEVKQVSLSDYISNKRIENVCNLLTQTDWTVAEIAERSGFQTKSHFFTFFKKSTGLTPNQYRVAMQEELRS